MGITCSAAPGSGQLKSPAVLPYLSGQASAAPANSRQAWWAAGMQMLRLSTITNYFLLKSWFLVSYSEPVLLKSLYMLMRIPMIIAGFSFAFFFSPKQALHCDCPLMCYFWKLTEYYQLNRSILLSCLDSVTRHNKNQQVPVTYIFFCVCGCVFT